MTQSQALLDAWHQAREQQRMARAVDIAASLEVPEAALLDSAVGSTGSLRAKRLKPFVTAMFEGLASFGHVKTITRNPSAVIEVEGAYGEVEVFGKMAQSVGEIDTRIFLEHWRHVYMLEEATPKGLRRSVQFFDRAGRAVHKIYLLESSNFEAFYLWVSQWEQPGSGPPICFETPSAKSQPKPDQEIDVASLREGWLSLKDTHDFFALLRRHGVEREQAFRLVGTDLATKVSPSSLETVLRRSCEMGLDIMIFVGNAGMIQIYTGPVHKVVPIKGWLNILDPQFNLHVHTPEVRSAWVVSKPTTDGPVTSLELFDQDGGQILYVFGKRKPGQAEQAAWLELTRELRS